MAFKSQRREKLSQEEIMKQIQESIGKISQNIELHTDVRGLQNPFLTAVSSKKEGLSRIEIPKEGGNCLFVTFNQLQTPFNLLTGEVTEMFHAKSPFLFQGLVTEAIDIAKVQMLNDEEVKKRYMDLVGIKEYEIKIGEITETDLIIFKKYIKPQVFAKGGVKINSEKITGSSWGKTYNVPDLEIDLETNEVTSVDHPVYRLSSLIRTLGTLELDALKKKKDSMDESVFGAEEDRIKKFRGMINVHNVTRTIYGFQLGTANGATEISRDIPGANTAMDSIITNNLRYTNYTKDLNDTLVSIINSYVPESNINMCSVHITKAKVKNVMKTSIVVATNKLDINWVAGNEAEKEHETARACIELMEETISEKTSEFSEKMGSGFYLFKWDNVDYNNVIDYLKSSLTELVQKNLVTRAVKETYPIELGRILETRDLDKLEAKDLRGKLPTSEVDITKQNLEAINEAKDSNEEEDILLG